MQQPQNNESKSIILSDQQEQIINLQINDAKIIACAGSGKTTTLIHKINKDIRDNIYDNKQFIVLTFTNFARDDFMSKSCYIANISGEKSQINKENVFTYHAYALKLYKKFKELHNESCIINYQDSVAAMNQVMQSNPDCLRECSDPIKIIYVDEAQDLSPAEYDFIQHVKEFWEANMIMIGDPNESIYEFKDGSSKYLLEYPGKGLNLLFNYRSQKNIVDVSDRIKYHESNNCKSNDATYPVNYHCHKYQDCFSTILGLLQQFKKDGCLHDVAIIGPNKKEQREEEILSLNSIRNYLSYHNIDINLMYNPESDNIDSESSVSKTIEHNHVNIMTSHASKGLEYKHVIAVGFNIGNSISRDHEELTNLWYVTFTRAKESLHIFSVEAEKNQYELFMNISDIVQIYGFPKNHILEHVVSHRQYIGTANSVTGIISNFTGPELYDFMSNIPHELIHCGNYYDPEFVHDSFSTSFFEYPILAGNVLEAIFSTYILRQNTGQKHIIALKSRAIQATDEQKKRIRSHIDKYTCHIIHKDECDAQTIEEMNEKQFKYIQLYNDNFEQQNYITAIDQILLETTKKSIDELTIDDIFYQQFFIYQISTQESCLWNDRYKLCREFKKIYQREIQNIIASQELRQLFAEKYHIQYNDNIRFIRDNKPEEISATFDAINSDMDKILELKSSNNVFNNKYILQCIIYNEINKQSNHDSCIYLFNILTGEMHKVDYHINDLNGFWAKIIRKMSKKNDILED